MGVSDFDFICIRFWDLVCAGKVVLCLAELAAFGNMGYPWRNVAGWFVSISFFNSLLI
jgi:hypothetical protein